MVAIMQANQYLFLTMEKEKGVEIISTNPNGQG